MNFLQVHQDGSTASDTVSLPCVPIILVPGVMGSRIEMPNAHRTWDPDDKPRMGRWFPLFDTDRQDNRRALSVNATRTAATITELSADAALQLLKSARCLAIAKFLDRADDIEVYYGTDRNWASVVWSRYGPALLMLEAKLNSEHDDPDFPVYAFGYDWRQSNATSGQTLADFIQDVLRRHAPRAADVVLVTHSMGGLVVRGALANDPGGGTTRKSIRGVLHCAQPSNGSLLCYRRFLSGACAVLDGTSRQDTVLAHIQGDTPARFAYNFSGLPGPLELLPNHRYQEFFDDDSWLRGLGSSVDLARIYDVYRSDGVPGLAGIVSLGEAEIASREERMNATITSDFARNLATVQAFHESIERTWHERTVALVSTGHSTDHAIQFNNLNGSIARPAEFLANPRWQVGSDEVTDNATDITFLRDRKGDGTVPDLSALCPGADSLLTPAEPVRGPQHADVLADPEFNRYVEHYVRALLGFPPMAAA